MNDKPQILHLENETLRISVVPDLGGKILSVYHKQIEKEFLWTNENLPLKKNSPGDDYDSNFIGGIDELLPNDIPETIDGNAYPDHGELWTTALKSKTTEKSILVEGLMPVSKLEYRKEISLSENSPEIVLKYRIKNNAPDIRHFLWKLHAALKIEAGDKILSSARFGKVADAAYSRFTDTDKFIWPVIEQTDASVIPPKSGSLDFFYLSEVSRPVMQLLTANGKHLFSMEYELKVFPFQWIFASYGGFLDHYVAILEPCSTMPISVNEAMQKNQCTVLHAGEILETTVRIFAGEKKNYLSVHE